MSRGADEWEIYRLNEKLAKVNKQECKSELIEAKKRIRVIIQRRRDKESHRQRQMNVREQMDTDALYETAIYPCFADLHP